MDNSRNQFVAELKRTYEAVLVFNDKIIMAYDFNESTGSNYSMFVDMKYKTTVKTLQQALEFANEYKGE